MCDQDDICYDCRNHKYNCVCDEDDETKYWDESDWKAYNEELKEQEEERRAEIAWSCKCGAWIISKTTGKAIHVADCCCGAE